MANQDFDLIVIGGGIAGSTLGTLVAGSGARVAVIERETEFRDRNRGEWIAPWGVREARRLGPDHHRLRRNLGNSSLETGP